MGDTFIDQVKRNNSTRGTEYEDYLIAGEIEHVKSMIEFAVKKNRNSITWTYKYDSYESITLQIDDLYNGNIYNVEQYLDSPCDVDFFSYGGLCYYLATWKDGMNAQHYSPSRPDSLNFDYIKRKLEKELYNLGCKSVRLLIGPQTVSYRKYVKKGLFHETYEDATTTVTAWVISISW